MANKIEEFKQAMIKDFIEHGLTINDALKVFNIAQELRLKKESERKVEVYNA